LNTPDNKINVITDQNNEIYSDEDNNYSKNLKLLNNTIISMPNEFKSTMISYLDENNFKNEEIRINSKKEYNLPLNYKKAEEDESK
jgi:hypothetical protein